MLQNRFLILLGACFLASSAAWADDLGYVDCSKHPQNTEVLAKAGKTPEVVTSLPCGERFTILLSGTFFSRIQTKDGKVGFVHSYVISRDVSAASPRKPAPAQVVASPERASAPAATAVQLKAPKPGPAPAPATSAAAVEPKPATPASPEPAPAQAPASASNAPAASAPAVEPKPAAPAPLEAAPAQPAPAQPPAPTSDAPAASASAAQPEPATPAPPPPAPAKPIVHPPRSAASGPIFGSRYPRGRTVPMVELFGGFAYARLISGGYGTNIYGGLGSFGWNATSWLQVVADTSYNVVTVSGTKTVLYGNHFGPRIFHRKRSIWAPSPFVEALVGGSRVDTTTAGVKTSDQGFSFKVGGGLDIRPSRHIEVRVFNVDYYRTSFASTTNPHQNNYWASAGFVLRFLGGAQ